MYTGKLNLNPTIQDIRDFISGHYPIVLELISVAVSPLDQPVIKEKKDRLSKKKGEILNNSSKSSEDLLPTQVSNYLENCQ